MRQAGADYLQEEARYRGARPRVRAVLYPFDLDFGLAPGSGTFVQTACGGDPGSLVLKEGYGSGSWTSPVLQPFSPSLDRAIPSWEDPGTDLDVGIYLRSGETPAAVAGAPFAPLSAGEELPLDSYFQVKVEFPESLRSCAIDAVEEADGFAAWARDQAPDQGYDSFAADTPGPLTSLRLEGRLGLPEREIIDLGGIKVDLARDFSELRAGDNILVMDNRLGQWLNRPGNSYLQGMDWTKKQLALYHGWELENGSVFWQLVYQGVLQGITGMAHGWQGPHRVRLESQDVVAAALKQAIGAPSSTGDRRPFLRGTYVASGELVETTLAALSESLKGGSGSAAMLLLGTYRGEYPQEYLIQVESSGEVGTATFRWSINGGQSWNETNLPTAGAEDPVELEEGLAVYWVPAIGADLVAGDCWTFTATTPVYHYQVYGAPFEAIAGIYLNNEATGDRVTADPAIGIINVIGRSGQVDARVVKDGTTHPVDIIADILKEVGLTPAIDQDSFGLAKSLTPEYAIGVMFENLPASQAIREIVRRCLYDLWIDFGEIKIRPYLDED